jgi:hypothetical protein
MSTEVTGGTVIRGADGALYFVPDSALAAYKLTEEQQSNLETAIDRDAPTQRIDAETAFGNVHKNHAAQDPDSTADDGPDAEDDDAAMGNIHKKSIAATSSTDEPLT